MGYYILKSYKFYKDPIFIFERIKKEKYCFFLDSSLHSNELGRYSFLGFEPFFVIKTKGHFPSKDLRSLFNRYKIKLDNFKLPFFGGAVGFLSYDLGFSLEEKLIPRIPKDLDIPDCFFGFYSSGIIVDHLASKLYIFSLGFPEKDYLLAKLLARQNFKKLERILSEVNFSKSLKFKIKRQEPISFTSNFTKDQYLEAVKKAKDYIRKGDIYQVNLSQRFEIKKRIDGFEVYLKLRTLSPSFYSAYLKGEDFEIISSSPEEFLRLKDNLVITRPMKGTRPRSNNKKKDTLLKKELLNSEKDKAELIMIVDLERNDLGRVCRYSSIKVENLRKLEVYSTVFQTTSTVRGILSPGKDRFDLIGACFPGGSITGCPKLRAMQIIEELETRRRSIYTGALGYLSFTGDMNLNILIRTILKKGNKFYFGVGGGIVADSHPEKEYEETLVKAKAMLKSFN
ncbi:MAG: aminodeoxychorismate synthase component I [Candidatus Omnitrophica bacterium]|nr:aminodeoxychorismate synthase component I [Candidatus Omnitrophota bacterium]MCM8800252.1 aminodeoxychorismate synthase component I [Candidatus Omnitrophota bacterium]